jgi:hypothetical protein
MSDFSSDEMVVSVRVGSALMGELVLCGRTLRPLSGVLEDGEARRVLRALAGAAGAMEGLMVRKGEAAFLETGWQDEQDSQD